NPATALADPRFDASISGTANVKATVRDLLTRTPEAADYDIDGTLALGPSTIRGLQVDRGTATGVFRDSALQLQGIEANGRAFDARGSGRVAFASADASDFQYDIVRADLAELRSITGGQAAGQATTAGRLTGPYSALRFQGTATINRLAVSDVSALTLSGDYDVSVPSGEVARSNARVTAHGS